MFCQKCGAENPQGVRLCHACGNELATSGAANGGARRVMFAVVALAGIALVSTVVVIGLLLLDNEPAPPPTPIADRTATSPAAVLPTDRAVARPTTIPTAAVAELGTSNLYIEYILDASNSMNDALPDGTVKRTVAEKLLADHLRAFRPETNIGLRAFGHRVGSAKEESCQDIEQVAPVQKGQVERIVSWLRGVQPQGWTPLAEAIRQALGDFVFDPARINAVVLLSDGQETCGGDPCKLVEELKTQGVNFTIHVIGLNVDEPTRQQLTCIARQAGGTYHDARSDEDLGQALGDVQSDVSKGELIVPPGPDTPTPMLQLLTDTPQWQTPIGTPPMPTPTNTPAASPSGLDSVGHIAFCANRDGVYGIYIMNADGTGVTRLIEGDTSRLACSPDGTRIAFSATFNTGRTDIYTINVDGTGLTNLTDDAAWDWGASWSPDSKRIAFGSYHDGDMDIFVINVDGRGLTRLTSSPKDEGSPSWSPDGARIVFESQVYESKVVQGKVQRTFVGSYIAVMNADGSEVRYLTSTPSSGDNTPRWSPDGTRIAFDSCRAGVCGIYALRADGTEATLLTAGGFFPSWSPDGKRIVFMRIVSESSDEIFVMNADGSDQINISNHPADVENYPCWLP